MGLLDRIRAARRPPLHVAIDGGEGPPVVLVHGIASSSVTFANLVPLLTGRHRVIAVDLLGFGGSPAPAEATYTLEEHADYLERTLERLRLREPFVLVGHSLGALIAIRYAATHSSKLAGLVLVSPPIYLPPEVIGNPVDRMAMQLYRRVYGFLRREKAFTVRNAALIERLAPIDHVLEVNDRTWRAFTLSLEHSIESQTAIADIAEVEVPIHVVYGTLDPLIVPGTMRIIERMRHVTSHRVFGADHFVRPGTARVVAAAIGTLSARR